ncbi:hypothetical protein Q8A73_007022 [Channa argus]|nr:hypothetical protein Q8A73_007022 [Channa argus]
MKICVSGRKETEYDGGGRYVREARCSKHKNINRHDVPSRFRVVLTPSTRMTASLNHTSLSAATDADARRRPVRSTGQCRKSVFLNTGIWWRLMQSDVSDLEWQEVVAARRNTSEAFVRLCPAVWGDEKPRMASVRSGVI